MKRIWRWFRKFLFPPSGASKWMRMSPFFMSGIVFLTIATSGIYTWEYTNSPEFCGTGCHSMPPEYTRYLVSPHAQIKCVECHIGRAFIGNQFTRKLGDLRHVVAALTQNYEYPIHVHTLRPAEEVCERCHSVNKFAHSTQKEIFHYQEDEGNSLDRTYLVLKTGGGSSEEGLGKGIHWHIQNPVFYYATDEAEQDIPYIRILDEEISALIEYVDVTSGFNPYSVEESELKKMDCITCHNRISHAIPKPEEAVDLAMSRGLISPSIPNIRARAVEVLRGDYSSNEQAVTAIQELENDYRNTYPEFFESESNVETFLEAIDTLVEIYTQSVFPDQKVDWDTHPDNIGHESDPGCFRCHDGKHLDLGGSAIRLACNLCHATPVISGPEAELTHLDIRHEELPRSHRSPNWIALHRLAYDENDENNPCSGCHEIGDYAAADNSTFCANSACHGSAMTSIDLTPLDTGSVFEKMVQHLPHYPGHLEPVAAWADIITLDDLHIVQEEMVCEDCHDPFPPISPPSDEVCIECHGEDQFGVLALTELWNPNPHDGHDGGYCYTCHFNFGTSTPDDSCGFCHTYEAMEYLGDESTQGN